MRGAPGFRKWPDPVDGMWKIEMLHWLRYETGVDVLVETGTCEGVTPFNLHRDFRQIFTVELHEGLYLNAKERLSGIENVHQFLGSSRKMLEAILVTHVQRQVPAMFWLDAHSSGPHTADDGNPLADELKVIMRLRPDALIVIDDMKDARFSLRHLIRAGVYLRGWRREFRTGEVIIHREGAYEIPPFEEAT